MSTHILAPSLLAGDHARLADSAQRVRDTGLEWLHLDIMDGHFVPNLSFGPQMLADLREVCGELFFDTHLMLENAEEHIDAFVRCGADLISVHLEPRDVSTVANSLDRIRTQGIQCGIALNPDTPAAGLQPLLAQVDLVLIMTVQPGYGGQAFRTDVLPKIRDVARMRDESGLTFKIEVDGGIDLKTGPLCIEAGADILVAGTAFFRAPDPKAFHRSILP